jgi:hypothetical protein
MAELQGMATVSGALIDSSVPKRRVPARAVRVLAWMAALAVAVALAFLFYRYSASNWPGSRHSGTDEAFGLLGAATGFWLAAAVVRGTGPRTRAFPSVIEIVAAPVALFLFFIWAGHGAPETSYDGEPFVTAGSQMRVVMVAAVLIRLGLGIAFACSGQTIIGSRSGSPLLPSEEADLSSGVAAEEHSAPPGRTIVWRRSRRATLGAVIVAAATAAGAEAGDIWATRLWHPALLGHSCPFGAGASCLFHPLLVSGLVWSVLGGLIGFWFGIVGAGVVDGRRATFGVGERGAAVVVTGLFALWAFFFGSQQGGTSSDLLVLMAAVAVAWLLRALLARLGRSRVVANAERRH